MIKISVTDNGPGISLLDQSKLFKPFSKLEANAELNPNGIGLGLSICKVICNGLGGDIVVSSDETGSKFIFWVSVKVLDDENVYLEPTTRPGLLIEDIQIQEVQTKERINMKTFLMQTDPFATLLGRQLNLQILCADDNYYNLEVLGLVFESLKLLDYIKLFNDGRQLIDYFINTTQKNIAKEE